MSARKQQNFWWWFTDRKCRTGFKPVLLCRNGLKIETQKREHESAKEAKNTKIAPMSYMSRSHALRGNAARTLCVRL